ncbi:type VII secretion-associated serine protease mycosin [Krasilnikovia sp. MM14-A1259]|uniref:type VII secretion-associated serine protease mycosin n=1 Tax=Krasilnikovia sp. MM14-A1259 TaxID=3373539 RepID=UPI00399D167F
MTGRRLPRRLAAAVLAGLVTAGTCAAPAWAAPTWTAPLAEPAHLVEMPAPWHGDSVRAEQWHLKTLNVAGAWTYSSGQGVTVAVIDSGVDARHVDLAGQVLPGLDLVDPRGDGDTDLVGHGTTVSAIIAGHDDADGVVGIAPKAKILPVRVLDEENRYDDAMIVAKGVRWAVDHGARVINLSLGGNGSSAALAAALDYAFAKDVVVVACTGNASASPSSGVWYPAREPGVIAVAGMERGGDVLWSGSITGKETVVTAPATQLVGARPDGYWRVQGTSFAAPMVSATAALIRSRWPTMSAPEVINRIIRTAKDRGAPGRDSTYGFGMVDPTGALTADVPWVPSNPLDNTPDPGISKFGSAPASGQAQSAPDDGPGVAGTRVPGANAGAAMPEQAAASHSDRGWWAAGALFLISVLAGLVTLRRFANVT